jgi:hypothetical protein
MPESTTRKAQLEETLVAVVYVERDLGDGRRKNVSLSISRGDCPGCRRPVLNSREVGRPPKPIDAIRLDDAGRLALDAHLCLTHPGGPDAARGA